MVLSNPDNDHVSITLSDVYRQAQAYNGNRLRDRYALLAIRSLFASSRYDACINYWNEIEEFLPDGLIKQLIRPYIAGAYYRTGAIERACTFMLNAEIFRRYFFVQVSKEKRSMK